jgi:Zn-dependent peptidase ImmA (M78 family)
MYVIKPYITAIAKDFWTKTGLKTKQPRDISGAVNLLLPIDIINLSELSIKKVVQWLNERSITFHLDVEDRNLHGFVLTYRGSGFIFINGTDPENERRYTIAHEASHFILDYKLPREKVIEKLGYQITEVLDGHRSPTIEERIDGLLSSVRVQPFTHLLEKVGDGSFDYVEILNSENDADALALELLAPNSNVIKDTKSTRNKISFSDFQEISYQILIEKYSIPEVIAKEYSLRLAYLATGGPSLLNKLGF